MTRPWAGRASRFAAIAFAAFVALATLAAAQAAAVEIPHGQGLLWRVERAGAAPSHVFGTLHSGDPEITRLPAPVTAAFRGADSLMVEVVRTAEVDFELLRASLLRRGDGLATLVGPERFERVKTVGARYGLVEKQLQRFKPWALMTLFSTPPDELLDRGDFGLPLDWTLQKQAEARGVPVHGLESAAEQIALFDGLATADQIAFLDAALAANGEIERWWQTFKDAYLAQDVAAIFALMTEQMAADDGELTRTFMTQVIDDRNRRMVERAADRLAEGNTFIAIGALHLPGNQGVLKLLEERGYQVTRVY